MARTCTCIRCKAEALVRSIYPDLDDARVLLAAEKIVKAIRGVCGDSHHVGQMKDR